MAMCAAEAITLSCHVIGRNCGCTAGSACQRRGRSCAIASRGQTGQRHTAGQHLLHYRQAADAAGNHQRHGGHLCQLFGKLEEISFARQRFGVPRQSHHGRSFVAATRQFQQIDTQRVEHFHHGARIFGAETAALAQRRGVTASAIRFYVAQGLLKGVQRLANGYRDYPPESATLQQKASDIEALQARLTQNREHLQNLSALINARPDDIDCQDNAARVLASMGITNAE